MDERQPHRGNYAELKKHHAEAQEHEQQQEPGLEPTRPEVINRSVNWPDRGGRGPQEAAAIKQSQVNNLRINEEREWKRMASDPEYAQRKQQELADARRENGLEHNKDSEGPQR
jgi:hypothetical protein